MRVCWLRTDVPCIFEQIPLRIVVCCNAADDRSTFFDPIWTLKPVSDLPSNWVLHRVWPLQSGATDGTVTLGSAA